MNIQPKDRPKWFQFRRRISSALVRLARLIYPDSPEVKAFWMEKIIESQITSNVFERIKWGPM